MTDDTAQPSPTGTQRPRGVRPALFAGLLALALVLGWFAARHAAHDAEAQRPDGSVVQGGAAPPSPLEPAAAARALGGREITTGPAPVVPTLAQRAVQPLRPASGPLVVPGRVVDDRGEPVRGAEVTMRLTDMRGVRDEASAVSGDDGRFQMRGLSPGDWFTIVTCEGLLGAGEFDGQIIGDGSDEVLVRLTRPATIAGSVLIEGDHVGINVGVRLLEALDQEPPADTRATIVAMDVRDGDLRTIVAVDEAGRYALSNLEPGRYAVVASAPPVQGRERLVAWAERRAAGADPSQLPDGVVEVTLAPGETRELDLSLPRSAVLRGRLQIDGGVARGGSVVAFQREPDTGLARTLRCDETGHFESAELPVGVYDLVAVADGEAVPRHRRVVVRAQEATDVLITFEGPGLEGAVVDAATRNPVPGAFVRLTPGSPIVTDPQPLEQAALLAFDWRKLDRDPRWFMTDSAGHFAMPRLVAGRYRLVASGGMWLQPRPVEIEIHEAVAPAPVTIGVTAAGSIVGRVSYAGRTVKPDGLEVTARVPGAFSPSARTTLHTGDFYFEGLAPGTYEVRLRNTFAYPTKEQSIRIVDVLAGRVAEIEAVLDD